MQFDTNNKIVRRCAEGMGKEGEGKPGEALALFMQAWEESETDIEKFISAHYIARHQNSVYDKLYWDELSLHHALNVDDEGIQTHLPSLYLNIAKCYEDLCDWAKAKENYTNALRYTAYLPDDGYGKLIQSGIQNGLDRIAKTGA